MFGIKRTHWWSALTPFAPVNGAFMNLRPHLSLMVRGFLQSELCNNGKPNLLCATLISTRPFSLFHASLTAFSSFINDSIITLFFWLWIVCVCVCAVWEKNHKINPNYAALLVTDKLKLQWRKFWKKRKKKKPLTPGPLSLLKLLFFFFFVQHKPKHFLQQSDHFLMKVFFFLSNRMWSRQSDCLSRRYYRKLLIEVKGLTSVLGNRHTGLRTAMQDCNYKEDCSRCFRLHMENDQTMTFIQTDYILDASLLSPLPLYLCTQTSPFHVDKDALNDRIQRRHLCVFLCFHFIG